MKKKCSKCGKIKSYQEFTKKSGRKDGLNSQCKNCTRKMTKKHYQENTQYYIDKSKKQQEFLVEWYNDYKKKNECEKCGEKKWYVLQFHHRDSKEKETEISSAVRNGWSLNRLKKEIEKCDILCSNCHIEYHYLERIAH